MPQYPLPQQKRYYQQYPPQKITIQKEIKEPEVKWEPLDVKNIIKQGSQAYSEGRYEDAILAWQLVLEEEPDKHPDIKKSIEDTMAKIKRT